MRDRIIPRRRKSLLEGAFVTIVLVLSTGILSFFPTIFLAGSPISTYFWLVSYLGVGMILCFNHGIRWLFWFVRYRSLLGLVLLAAVASVSWSVDPALTLQRTIHLIGTTLVGYYIGFHVPPRTALLLLAWALTFTIVGNAFVALALPEVGQEVLQGTQVWKGWHYQKNGLGFTATIAVLFFAIQTLSVDIKHRWVYRGLSFLSFVVLLKSDSATALVALSAGVSIAIGLSLANGLRLPGWITGSLLSLLLIMMGVGGVVVFYAGELERLTGLVGRSADLTGRTPLWEMVLSLVKERPWLGFGYGGLWSPKPGTESIIGPLLKSQLGWLPPSAHNGFLNIASELGLPIATIAVLFSIQTFIEPLLLYLRRPSNFALLVVTILAALIVRTLTEQVIFTDRTLNWIIFVALPILLLRLPWRQDMLSMKSSTASELSTDLPRKDYPKVADDNQ